MDLAREFPGLGRTTYLDSCAHGLLPRRARDAMDAHMDRWEGAPDWADWNETVEAARRRFARLVNAPPENVAVLSNASSAVSAVMTSLHADERDRLVTADLDFPTTPFVAQRQTARGFAHDHLHAPGGRLSAAAFAEAMGDDVALACVPAVASFNGFRIDVPAFAKVAQEVGAPLLADAFQAAGTFPIDVRAWDVDFLVTGVYKWLLGPSGVAFLYAKETRFDLEPAASGWYAADDPSRFDPMDALAPDARRFQSGGPSVIGCVGAAASLDLLHEVGVDEVARRSGALVSRVIDEARERKWEVLTPDEPKARASIVTFRVPDLERALAACAREDVKVNSRLGGIRVSPHVYNSETDVARLFDVLDAA